MPNQPGGGYPQQPQPVQYAQQPVQYAQQPQPNYQQQPAMAQPVMAQPAQAQLVASAPPAY
jgi:hypothetical protein